MTQTRRKPISAAEREAMAKRLGVSPHLVPAHITLCPARTHALDASKPGGWKGAAEKTMRVAARARRMGALLDRETKARRDVAQDDGHVYLTASGKVAAKPRVPGARIRPSRAKNAADKVVIARHITPAPKVKQAPRQPVISERDLQIMQLLRDGMGRSGVARAIGLKSKGSVHFIIEKLRKAGYDLPRKGGAE